VLFYAITKGIKMADFGWSMPAGAEEAKDRQDRKDADWDAALAEETEAQLEELNDKLAAGDEDAIQAVADQLCPISVTKSMASANNVYFITGLTNAFFKAKKDAAEIMAINKMESR
jgi:hypothetical protein